MKLKVTKRYFDKLEDVYVKEGDVIERDPDRAKQLIASGVAKEIQKKPGKERKPKADPDGKADKEVKEDPGGEK